MIWSDFAKGGLLGFWVGVCGCVLGLLLFYAVTSQPIDSYPQNSKLDPVETRLNILEHQVRSINERLSDTNINAMREQVILQTGDINALRNRVYKIEFEWGK